MVLKVSSFLAICLCIGLSRADDRKTTTDLIRSRGFNADEFDVVAQNYILKVYRVINPLADPKKVHKIPVVACHGISFDSANMLSLAQNARPRKPKLDERVTLYAMENGTDDRGIHFYLSNNNYDVWLFDSRATNEKGYRRLEDGGNNKTFWDFSIDEQALIDLPTQIEFVLQKTGAKKVAYIAYSQSTTLMFALLSMKPEFSEKIATFVALAPVVYTSHIRGMAWPASLSGIYGKTSTAVATVPTWLRRIQNFALTYFCSISFIKNTFCRGIWRTWSGPDKDGDLEGGTTENILKSTSLKTFEQYIQNAFNHDFRMYDYKDEMRNIEEYGQPVPPQYNISKINLKTIALFRGTEDYLSNAQDQMILLSKLRVPVYEDHVLEGYSHIDFIISPTIVRDINEPVLRIFDKITNRSVARVSHTLGNPNPEVQGTQLVIDVKKDYDQVKDKVRSHTFGSFDGFPSQPKAERPKDGVANKPDAKSVKEQLLL